MTADGDFDRAILDLGARIVFIPVRHHSPACARLVQTLVERIRPAAVLVEGPSDFNDRLDELSLGHTLPIAIYSHVRTAEDERFGCFYPFCEYSPEWQALRSAREVGARAAFIDLPWAQIVAHRQGGDPLPAHRYADGELRRSPYVDALCAELGVDDFDALWDVLFEVPASLSPEALFERAHVFCHRLRASDAFVSPIDLLREEAMAAAIRATAAETEGRIIVLTGGYHSHALFQNVGRASARPPGDGRAEARPTFETLDRGIALTPYSYARLDNLTGYESGMPNPGFYHRMWTGEGHRSVLAAAVLALRVRKQTVSTADLVAVESTARALAALRAHDRVWRRDLIDGLTAAVLKDEIEGVEHPFLQALHEALRGNARGLLAAGTALPPLVADIRTQLHALDLEPQQKERTLTLELMDEGGRARSRLLHRLRILGIPGFRRTGGTDFAEREDLTRVFEEWRLVWSPEQDAACIEASLYGATVDEAVFARLTEEARAGDRDAEAAALLFLRAALAGIRPRGGALLELLRATVRHDSSFIRVAKALGHLVYLYRFDEALGTAHRDDTGTLLRELYTRAVWLLETSGSAGPDEGSIVDAVQSVLHAFDLTGGALALDRHELVEVLRRVPGEPRHPAAFRGAATGALFHLRETGVDTLLQDVRGSARPEELGDFLSGVFALAREAAQRQPDVMTAIDAIVMSYDEQSYLTALPSLRLAFSYFTPREKHSLARSLLDALGLAEVQPLPALDVAPQVAAEAMAFESRLFATLERYRLRGGHA
ncbi:MAG TPA: DUF5682 family protein [Thermoanaerobaculia bacterium]